MANEFKKQIILFNEIELIIETRANKVNAHFALGLLVEKLEKTKNPLLVEEFQTYWNKISKKLQRISDQDYFARHRDLIENKIEQIMSLKQN